jgi:hypothetical protein
VKVLIVRFELYVRELFVWEEFLDSLIPQLIEIYSEVDMLIDLPIILSF